MKRILLLPLGLLLFWACGNQENPDNSDADYGYSESTEQNSEYNSESAQTPVVKKKAKPAPTAKEEVVMHPVQSQKYGVQMAQIPLPKSWKRYDQLRSDKVRVSGPHNLKVYEFPLASFVYTNDAYTRQMYIQSGQPMRNLPHIDDLMKEDFIPWAKTQGMELVKQYYLPDVTKANFNFGEQLFQSVPQQKQYWAFGTEWKKQNGEPYFLVINLFATSGAGLLTWYYYCMGLETTNSYFPQARDHFIKGLANIQYNPQYIQAYNQSEARKSNQSWAAHRQRMAQNQRNFDNSQRIINQNNQAANDAIMNGWKSRSAMTDRGHDQYINSIAEENTMVNPSTGETYQVESGSNQYWMNNDGEYIGTDDYNYNPNQDPSVNKQEWQQMEDYYE